MIVGVLSVLSGLLGPQTHPVWDALVGWYEQESGRHVLVTYGATGGLRLFDFEEPSFDLLEPDGEHFRWRRQGSSEVASVEFETDAGGASQGFAWSVADGAAGGSQGHARRDPSYGYSQAEVRFQSDTELCGLLMLPLAAEKAPGVVPGVVIVQGSGDSDRDNVWAFSIANHLALNGIAVLLPDKRGSGKSKGDWKAVGFEELAADALAGSDLLARQAGVDPARVGLVGLSQGGWVAPLAASRSSRGARVARVAFCASISAAAVSVREQVLHELEQTVRKGGGDQETVSLALELMQMALAYGETGTGWEEYSAAIELAPASLAEAFPSSKDDWRWSWYRRVLDFDPLPLWRGLSIPCLVVYGERDEEDNLPVQKSVGRLQSWIRESGRTDVEVSVFPQSGHALEDPATGWIRRDFLDALARWIAGSRAAR